MVFGGRYEILREGKHGGMGAVYKARDRKLLEECALKVIHPRLSRSDEVISRFRQEVSISRKLIHKNVVRVYDLAEEGGKEYFTMEWVEGKSLRDEINERKAEGKAYSIGEAVEIIGQLCDGLEEAHKYTVHRDIKPENILIRELGEGKREIKLTDFGIAKMLSASEFMSTSMQMGTPYYMAPEQKVDSGEVDKRADIYAVGVLIYELLTLENTIGLEMPSEINPEIPKEIDGVIKRAVATRPDKRYRDVVELKDELKKVISEGEAEREAKAKEEERRKEEEIELRRKEEEEAKRREQEARLEAERIQREQEEERQRIEASKVQQKKKRSFWVLSPLTLF